MKDSGEVAKADPEQLASVGRDLLPVVEIYREVTGEKAEKRPSAGTKAEAGPRAQVSALAAHFKALSHVGDTEKLQSFKRMLAPINGIYNLLEILGQQKGDSISTRILGKSSIGK